MAMIHEDRLVDILGNSTRETVKKLCQQAGVMHNGSKLNCVLCWRDKINSRKVYDKIFSKIWGASGL
jgi:hypothetical protein